MMSRLFNSNSYLELLMAVVVGSVIITYRYIGFQVLRLPDGGPYISFCPFSAVVVCDLLCTVSLLVQELPRASGPLFFFSEGFLCLLLVTMYDSKLNWVSGFSFCDGVWGLEEVLAYQSTSLSCSFLLLVTLREVPDLSIRG
jgi:hypothetical protein